MIVVLTFTLSISVAEGDAAEPRTVLAAAIGCNLAWGIVDAAMYLMSRFTERARSVSTLRAIRQADEHEVANQLIVEALPAAVAAVLTPIEIEALRERINQRPPPSALVGLNRTDFAGALGVFLLVFLSTFPVVIPFLVMEEIASALRTSNAIAVVMLFVTGWSLGRYAGRPGWRTGLGVVTVGVVLVGITMALGG